MSRSAGVVALGAVAATAAAIAWVGTPPRAPEPPIARQSVVAATRATLSCPGQPPRRSVATTVLAVTPAVRGDSASGGRGSGRIDLTSLGGDSVLGRLGDPGVVLERELSATSSAGAQVVAEGALAAGVTAAQWARSQEQPARQPGQRQPTDRGGSRDVGTSGLQVSWCQAPDDDWWFSGVNTSVGATSRLVLSNPTPALAVADLSLVDTEGPVEVVGGHGVAVAPESSSSINLAALAPGLRAATLHVAASSGRLVAAVRTEKMVGVTAGGSDWLPPSEPPATDVVLGSTAAGPGTQEQLVISNPGNRQALVRVQVIDSGGHFVPTGMTGIRIAPATVRVLDLTGIVGASRTAVRLSAAVPVTGAVTQTSAEAVDFAISSSSPVLDAPAVVPVIPGDGLEVTFVSGEKDGGKVGVATFAADGAALAHEDVQIEGERTTTWHLPSRVPAGGAGTAYVVITVEVDGLVTAVAHYTSPRSLATLPVLSGVSTVTRPGVQPAG